MGLKKRNSDLDVHHAFWFWYISFPSLHKCDVKVPNFTFLEDAREPKTTTFFFFFSTSIQSFRIHLQKKINAFNKFNEVE